MASSTLTVKQGVLGQALCVSRRGAGWDRPEAACPSDWRRAAGEAGGFNAVQKLFTNRESRTPDIAHGALAGATR